MCGDTQRIDRAQNVRGVPQWLATRDPSQAGGGGVISIVSCHLEPAVLTLFNEHSLTSSRRAKCVRGRVPQLLGASRAAQRGLSGGAGCVDGDEPRSVRVGHGHRPPLWA